MGSYATLRLGSQTLGVTKDEVDPGLMWLFRPSDKHVERIDARNRSRLAEYVNDEHIDDYDEDHPFIVVQYRCTPSAARDRLELKGFTRRVAETAFCSGLRNTIRNLERLADRGHRKLDDTLILLRSLTIDEWLNAFGRIVSEKLTPDAPDRILDSDPQLPLLRYMLSSSRDFFGFPGWDMRHFVRLAVERVSDDEELVYDMSDIAEMDYGEDIDDFVEYAEMLINEDFLLVQRVIVLTEGVTDRKFLERSLGLLYPHLVDYFHFFDFASHRVGGGAGELANLVRAFAAADVKHRILALFDNDTAAKSALSKLQLDALPRNITVRQYPDLKIARHYPTLGPSGETAMDVNGLAGGLELYFGEDVLARTGAQLVPVQWRGYEQGVGAYQGEILDKPGIQTAFEAKLKDCEDNPDRLDAYDWSGIRAILEMMRSAFHDEDETAILSEVDADLDP